MFMPSPISEEGSSDNINGEQIDEKPLNKERYEKEKDEASPDEVGEIGTKPNEVNLCLNRIEINSQPS